jgi:hypothetical protein
MPKAKKSVKLRDQKPMKDPRGGGARNKSLNTVASEGSKNQKHHHGGHSHF